MEASEYLKKAMRTNDGESTTRLMRMLRMSAGTEIDVPSLLMGCLGLAGESGEFCDVVKKWIFHEAPGDVEHLKRELGDVLWYVACICDSLGWSMDEVMEKNIDKLIKRYPEGFSVTRSSHRAEGDI